MEEHHLEVQEHDHQEVEVEVVLLVLHLQVVAEEVGPHAWEGVEELELLA